MITGFLIRFVIPVFPVIIMTTFLYKLPPSKKASLRSALRGALFTAAFLEIARHSRYTVWAAGQYGAIYGSLSAFVIFLMWILYAACIFLIGAEIVSNLEGGRKKGL